MDSCESGRSSAYSEDLRWRMVWQKHALGLNSLDIAKNLNVHRSTVDRVLQIFLSTGCVSKKSYPKEAAFRKITPVCAMFILNLVISNPAIYLHEVQASVEEFLLIDIHISTIATFLSSSGFSRQKLRQIALQRDEFERAQYVSDVSVYSMEMFVFIDETGADRRNMLRKQGYSVRGKPPQNHSLLVRGERVSAIACMSAMGILDVKVVKGTSNGDTFYDFLHSHLLPHLLPFDGRNPNSVVVLDNCSIHRISEVQQVLEEVGVLVHYLPPYSPDYNPIEEAFSKVKQTLRSESDEALDVKTQLYSSFTSISSKDCTQWIKHCTIYD